METNITEQLIVVGFTICQAFSLIMTMTQEWLLTFRTHKMLHMPLFAHSIHHAPFNWSSTCSTDGDTHFVMTG